ncbi:hypothetical protein F3Y22_tig00110472pilonHSYRG00260 [Hibiscus syriacus]|uniref:Uncharacterized protein n=1 Tax=Hibiscus syriacus TaxID=106335 RepID=A0A6A3AJ27_HIBSY|nr:hypothetical protein F3Y22_tig00110472pilonHSYRG00260 [Hibiscus syriacus]
MTNTSSSRLVLLFFIVVFMLAMRKSEARSYDHGKLTVAGKIDSMTTLEKLGYDLSSIAYYRRMLSGSRKDRALIVGFTNADSPEASKALKTSTFEPCSAYFFSHGSDSATSRYTTVNISRDTDAVLFRNIALVFAE